MLGAGASYGAGFPLAAELFARIYERLRPEEQKDLDAAMRYFYPSSGKAHSSPKLLSKVNIEEFMSLLDMAEDFNEMLPTTFLGPKAIRALRSTLLRAIVDLLVAKQLEAESDSRKLRYLDLFCSKLSAADTVITFNWDVLLERRLRKRAVPLEYCPQKGKPGSLAFLKLHGSIDWYRGAELESTVGFEVLHRQLYRATWQMISNPHSKPLTDTLPFIVPPTFFKNLRGCADAEEIWAEAFNRLRAADQIYFCGYRFPPEDIFGRFVFRRAIRFNMLQAEHGRKTALRLVVINPNEEVSKFVARSVYSKVRHEAARFEASSLTK